MYIESLPTSLTNFCFVIDETNKLISRDSWLKITRITNIGHDKEIRQKVIRISPEEQGKLYQMLKEKFEGE